MDGDPVGHDAPRGHGDAGHDRALAHPRAPFDRRVLDVGGIGHDGAPLDQGVAQRGGAVRLAQAPHLPGPTEVRIVPDALGEEVEGLPRGPEMDVAGRRQPDQVHVEPGKRGPELPPARVELLGRGAFGRLAEVLLEGRLRREGEQEVGVEAQARLGAGEPREPLLVDAPLRRDEPDQRLDDRLAEPDAAGVHVDLAVPVHRAAVAQRTLGQLVQEARDLAARSRQEDPVVGALGRRGLHGQARGRRRLQIELERAEDDGRVAGKDERPALDPRRDARRGDHEVVEQRGDAPVRQDVGGGREHLAARRVLGRALAVPAGVNQEDLLRGDLGRPHALGYRRVRVERRPSGAYAPAARIRNDEIPRAPGKPPLLQPGVQLPPVPLGLALVGRGHHDPVPCLRAGALERMLEIAPGVLDVLRQEALLGAEALLHRHLPVLSLPNMIENVFRNTLASIASEALRT